MIDTRNLKRRLAIVYLKEYFEANKHLPVTTNNLLDYLSFKDVFIERKTLTENIKALKVYGMDIQVEKGRKASYFYQGMKQEENNNV